MYALRFFAPTEDMRLPLLLPIGVIGIIESIVFIVDCLVDPYIASISDNSQNPKGRRIPMMRLAAALADVFALLIFMAPGPAESAFNVVWVAIFLPLFSVATSVYDVNLIAMIPELISDESKRTKQFIFKTVGMSVVIDRV
jgi:GPH family glycoside/pentoside/hexuronide:cation symporter